MCIGPRWCTRRLACLWWSTSRWPTRWPFRPARGGTTGGSSPTSGCSGLPLKMRTVPTSYISPVIQFNLINIVHYILQYIMALGNMI